MSNKDKANVIIQLAKKYELKTFCETGTYEGAMLAACLPHFDELLSVELDEKLYTDVKLRFLNEPKVHVYQGDSAEKLAEMLNLVTKPSLIWADAHYSGEGTAKGNSPIIQELFAVYKYGMEGSVILIDDAREFSFQPDYPSLATVINIAGSLFQTSKIGVVGDIIMVVPR